MNKQVEVFVEYCFRWGYDSRYRSLRRLILNEVPLARVSGNYGRPSAFEVFVNGELVYSKLETKWFPDFDEIVKIVANEFKTIQKQNELAKEKAKLEAKEKAKKEALAREKELEAQLSEAIDDKVKEIIEEKVLDQDDEDETKDSDTDSSYKDSVEVQGNEDDDKKAKEQSKSDDKKNDEKETPKTEDKAKEESKPDDKKEEKEIEVPKTEKKIEEDAMSITNVEVEPKIEKENETKWKSRHNFTSWV